MEDWNKKLTTAAEDGDIEALKLCLQNGADIDNQDFIFITQHCPVYQTSFDVSCIIPEIWRDSINEGCRGEDTWRSVDSSLIEDRYGETALMKAADGGHLEICRLLIDRGCKIDITDSDGYTALHYAAREGHLQITRCLVEQGGASPWLQYIR
ncbi:unnamed protein product [Mytilus edulis]|uniref:ANK_REP_REGION domain-containing protein n=1 Tax=Mytilus edulis TaxID=6550 RepID=A0A8S3VH82_MYTED|nr:unnamed protein product [Mytilus edulis]